MIHVVLLLPFPTGFPGVIGLVDGTEVKIAQPSQHSEVSAVSKAVTIYYHVSHEFTLWP
jgi:hypothetical protein